MKAAEIQALYEDYLEKARAAERDRRPGEGLFGFGRRPADDPCHQAFLQALHRAAEAPAGEEDARETAEALRWICDAPIRFREDPPSIYWTLVAAHGAMSAAIPRLSPGDARELSAHYEASWPKARRMPVQMQVLKALRRAAAGAGPAPEVDAGRP